VRAPNFYGEYLMRYIWDNKSPQVFKMRGGPHRVILLQETISPLNFIRIFHQRSTDS